ncbi:MAG: hypothetical protein AAF690_02835 [Acidobacteriota bacterium]
MIGDLLLFSVLTGGTLDDSIEVWATNGSLPGTQKLFEVEEAALNGPFPLNVSKPRPFATASDGRAIFVRSSFSFQEVWITDGTARSTNPLLPVFTAGEVQQVVVSGRKVFVLLRQRLGGWEIWSVDDNGSGAAKLAEAAKSTAQSMVVVDGSLMFFVSGGFGDPSRLFRTDGTPLGTEVVSLFPESQVVTDSATKGSYAHFLVGDFFGDPSEPPMSLWRSRVSGPPEKILDLEDEPRVLHSGGEAFLVDSPTRSEIVRRLYSFKEDGTLDLLAECELPCQWNDRIGADGGLHQFLLWSDREGTAYVSDGTSEGTRSVWQGSMEPLRLFDAVSFGERDSVFAYPLAPGPQVLRRLSAAGREDITGIGSDHFALLGADDGGLDLLLVSRGDFGTLTRLEIEPGPCPASPTTLCLGDGRFELEVEWTDFQGSVGSGRAQQLTQDTGSFWFFSPENLELIVKVVDGTPINGHHWVFYGALSDVGYRLTVTDRVTLRRRTYVNPPRTFASRGDTQALLGGPGEVQPRSSSATDPERRPELPDVASVFSQRPSTSSCATSAQALCLQDRFLVSVRWQDFTGGSGRGTTLPLTTDTGGFWFFDTENVELVVKVLDGRALNGKFWVFFGALSDVAYDLEVMDTVTGAVRTYTNPARNFGSVGDTQAFDG